MNKRKFVLVFIIFFGPLLMATLLYFSDWRPQSTVQGELIQPSILVSTIGLEETKIKQIKGKWVWLYSRPAQCERPCTLLKKELAKLRVALGKNMDRVLLLETSNANLMKNKIYIIDPLGNIILKYDSGQDMRAIFKDMSRLLKISKIG